MGIKRNIAMLLICFTVMNTGLDIPSRARSLFPKLFYESKKIENGIEHLTDEEITKALKMRPLDKHRKCFNRSVLV